jgi:glycosyltransferase involved in cell wall biosynthesis
MRILMISKACLVEAYQTKLKEIGQAEGVELAVIVPPVWRDPAGPIYLEQNRAEGYRLWVDPLRLNGHFHLYYYPTLRRRLADFQPDILHVDEEPYNLATWLAVRQARAAGVKSLFFSWQNLHNRYPFPFSLMEKQVLEQVDYAIVGNEASGQVWRAKGYKGPYQVIPQFGVCPDFFRPQQRASDSTLVIGSTSRRLVPEKGIDLLLQAVAGLAGDWRLHIAGEGPARPSLEALATRLGIAGRVSFDGGIRSEQMPAYLQQLDVLVLPSRTLPNWKEQFGRVLIEAMACEVVVVGSDSGEIPHVIGDAGFVFPEGDVPALRRRLQQLLLEPALRRQLACAGRRRVLERYTQARIAAHTVAVYRTLMGTSQVPPTML